jgi:hypothetical protein
VHEGNDALWGADVRVKLKVQGNNVGRFVAEVIEAVKEVEDDLEQIVTRPEGKHGMKGGYHASTGREVEKVAVSIPGETTVCWLGELSGKDVNVRIIPLVDRMEACELE